MFRAHTHSPLCLCAQVQHVADARQACVNDVVSSFDALTMQKRKRRFLVYCMTRADVEFIQAELARELGGRCLVHAFHGDLPEGTKNEVLACFLTSEETVGVAGTTAFGAGVDSPDVDLVIHNGPGYGLAQMAQEAGRGGRDDKVKCRHTMYCDETHLALLEKQAADPDQAGTPTPSARQRHHARLLLSYVHDTTMCRRYQIDAFLSGRQGLTSTCIYEKGHVLPCDNCLAAMQSMGQEDSLLDFADLGDHRQNYCYYCNH